MSSNELGLLVNGILDAGRRQTLDTLYTRFTKLQTVGSAVHSGILCIRHCAKYHSVLHVHCRVIGTLEYFWLLDGLYRHEKLMDSPILPTLLHLEKDLQ